MFLTYVPSFRPQWSCLLRKPYWGTSTQEQQDICRALCSPQDPKCLHADNANSNKIASLIVLLQTPLTAIVSIRKHSQKKQQCSAGYCQKAPHPLFFGHKISSFIAFLDPKPHNSIFSSMFDPTQKKTHKHTHTQNQNQMLVGIYQRKVVHLNLILWWEKKTR